MTAKLERWSGLVLAYGSLAVAVYGVLIALFGIVYLNTSVLLGIAMTLPYLVYRTRKPGTTTIPYQHKLT